MPANPQPVPADDGFQRLHYRVTYAGVQMESAKDPFVHSSFDRVSRTAIRCGGQIHDRRSDRELEPVAERRDGRVLQHLSDNVVLVAARRCRDPLHRAVDVYR